MREFKRRKYAKVIEAIRVALPGEDALDEEFHEQLATGKRTHVIQLYCELISKYHKREVVERIRLLTKRQFIAYQMNTELASKVVAKGLWKKGVKNRAVKSQTVRGKLCLPVRMPLELLDIRGVQRVHQTVTQEEVDSSDDEEQQQQRKKRMKLLCLETDDVEWMSGGAGEFAGLEDGAQAEEADEAEVGSDAPETAEEENDVEGDAAAVDEDLQKYRKIMGDDALDEAVRTVDKAKCRRIAVNLYDHMLNKMNNKKKCAVGELKQLLSKVGLESLDAKDHEIQSHLNDWGASLVVAKDLAEAAGTWGKKHISEKFATVVESYKTTVELASKTNKLVLDMKDP
jgi:hypothetical protein